MELRSLTYRTDLIFPAFDGGIIAYMLFEIYTLKMDTHGHNYFTAQFEMNSLNDFEFFKNTCTMIGRF